MKTEREELIDSIRALADFLEQHPGVPMPMPPRFDAFCYTKEQFADAAKAIGGKLEKHIYGEIMTLRREFGAVQYDLNIERDLICERVVIGKRIVEALPEHEEDVVEWRCGSVLEFVKAEPRP